MFCPEKAIGSALLPAAIQRSKYAPTPVSQSRQPSGEQRSLLSRLRRGLIDAERIDLHQIDGVPRGARAPRFIRNKLGGSGHLGAILKPSGVQFYIRAPPAQETAPCLALKIEMEADAVRNGEGATRSCRAIDSIAIPPFDRDTTALMLTSKSSALDVETSRGSLA
jgi:hypothetical protein